MKKYKKNLALVLCMIMVLCLASCGESETSGEFEPHFTASSFDSPENIGGGVSADFSKLAQGYAGFKVNNDKQIVIQLCMGDNVYNFFAPQNESLFYIPMSFGNGNYTFRFLQNSSESKYVEVCRKSFDVTLDDEFQPFIRANLITMYDENSECVKKAAELAADCESDNDFIKKVYNYISDNVSYDDEKSESVSEGYIPYPDDTLATGKGICFDYSSLAAAMLRSQGIPTKIITGYVGEDALYHAWNSFYTKEGGWISVEIKVSSKDWTRMDVTFGSGGNNDKVSYVDRYIY